MGRCRSLIGGIDAILTTCGSCMSSTLVRDATPVPATVRPSFPSWVLGEFHSGRFPPKMCGKCSENVRNWGCPLPQLSPGLWLLPKMFGRCSGNVREMFGVGGCPIPLGGGPPQMFGNVRKCSELVGAPPHPSPGVAVPGKCSDMFGPGGCPSSPLPRGGGSPKMFGKC